MRNAPFIVLLAGLITTVSAAPGSNAVAQETDAGTHQYLENPPVGAPDGTQGGSGGGGSGSGGGTEQSPVGSEPSGGSASSGGTGSFDEGAAADTGTNSARANRSSADGGSNGKPRAPGTATDKSRDALDDAPLGQAQSSSADDSGPGGIGILLPIILGALLLAAVAVAVVRRRRRTAPA